GPRIALEARSRQGVERKALGAFLALLGARPVERPLAFAPVEAGDVAAVERQPGDTVAVDVHAADAEAGLRDFIDLGECGIGWVRTRRQAEDVARMGEVRAPDRPVGRRPRDRVHAVRDARVLRGIDRLARLVPARGALAAADGIDDQRRPALRFGRITRLPEQFGVDPAD